jgi:hypothetical protein
LKVVEHRGDSGFMLKAEMGDEVTMGSHVIGQFPEIGNEV